MANSWTAAVALLFVVAVPLLLITPTSVLTPRNVPFDPLASSEAAAGVLPSTPATPAIPALSANQSAAPSARDGAGMVYDANSGYFLLFGGQSNTGCGGSCTVVFNDTWVYAASHWTKLNLTVAPSPRAQMGMAYNSQSGRVILFGGIYAPNGYNFNDTWSFYGGLWHNISSTAGQPPPRHSQVMVFDAHDGYVLMFGGAHRANGGQPSIGDTWKFASGFWTQIGSCGGPSQPLCGTAAPSVRLHADAAYNVATGKTVLFGGTNGTWVGSDTWAFQGGTWTNLTGVIGVSPRPQQGGAMAYSAALNHVVLFGGTGASGAFRNASWEYSAGKWKLLNFSGKPNPVGRVDGELAYNSSGNYLLLFGGDTCWPPTSSCVLNDTWRFLDGLWLPSTNSSPSARTGSSLAFDGKDGYTVLFGGLEFPGHSNQRYCNDTWISSEGIWANITRGGPAPTPRTGASLTYDGKDGYLVLFGGAGPGHPALNDTWKFAAGVWTNISVAKAPSPRSDASMTYDSSFGRVILFGGSGSVYLNDTWTFSNGNWSNITQSGAPPARGAASVSYFAPGGYAVLFGGVTGPSHYLNDTWEFFSGNWTNVTRSVSPLPRDLGGMAFYSKAGYTVLFGGAGNNPNNYLGDTWRFSNGTWANITPLHSPPTYHTYPPVLGYDSKDGLVLLFQLHYGPGSLEYEETWAFFGGAWTQLY